MCAELKIQSEELLGDYEKSLADFRYFQRAVQYADTEYRTMVQGYDEKIRERLRQERYDRLVQEKNEATTEREYQKLVIQFREMHGYRDTVELANECDHQYCVLKERREEEERQYDQLVQEKNEASAEDEFPNLAKRFRAMNGYKDTAKLASECDNQYRMLTELYINFGPQDVNMGKLGGCNRTEISSVSV